MKIAIHPNENTFSERWIDYCKKNGVNYIIVNCYKSDIIQQLEGCDIFMWHHNKIEDHIFAKQLLFSLEVAGIKVFPNFNTGWHFDDKVGQKYLLEAIKAPLIPSYVFYKKTDALNWANKTQFPKIFKLRGGSGSNNVILIKNKQRAIKYIKKSFNKGFLPVNPMRDLKDRIIRFKKGKGSFMSIIKGLLRFIIPNKVVSSLPRHKGYVYFQDFIPNNIFDIRIVTVADKAIGIKRYVRDGDFRASGSGNLSFKHEDIDERCVEIAFKTDKNLGSVCTAYDFVFDEKNNPLIVEISYGFTVDPYNECDGYWDEQINWHEGKSNPQYWMIENILK